METNQNIDAELSNNLFRQMLRIRMVEEAVIKYYPEQEMRCPIHLCNGQEAVAVGVCAGLKKDDFIFSNYRSHAHYLAKGGNLKSMIAEFYGKESGCSKGMGGSMHLIYPSAGLMGTSAIAGGVIPVAVGSALSFAMSKKNSVSVVFFGDGATETGVFSESLNFASLKKTPVIFICENNLYAVQTHISRRQASPILKRAESFNIISFEVDGNDVFEVLRISKDAIEFCRRGKGPVFIEARTYRWLEHVGMNFDYEMGYRSKEEVDEWMEKCPIKKFEKYLIENNLISEKEIKNMISELNKEIEEAFSFAKRSYFPKAEQIYKFID